MKLNEMKASEGARFVSKRIGRGLGSGTGKTSGKGQKGQNSRSGGGTRLGFEGGQMPLYRRIPKRGFTNHWKKEYVGVNVEKLNCFEDGATVTTQMIIDAGLANKVTAGVKILGGGELKKNLTVQAEKFSDSAIEKIVAAGGKAEVI